MSEFCNKYVHYDFFAFIQNEPRPSPCFYKIEVDVTQLISVIFHCCATGSNENPAPNHCKPTAQELRNYFRLQRTYFEVGIQGDVLRLGCKCNYSPNGITEICCSSSAFKVKLLARFSSLAVPSFSALLSCQSTSYCLSFSRPLLSFH